MVHKYKQYLYVLALGTCPHHQAYWLSAKKTSSIEKVFLITSCYEEYLFNRRRFHEKEYTNLLELFILLDKPQRFRAKWKFFRLRTIFSTKFREDLSKHQTTQHGGRVGEQERVTMCCQEATVCFSTVIDRRSVSVVIVRGLCDVCVTVWSNMNSATFVTDEQNTLSQCPAEGVANLVPVRIRCLSV